MGCDIPNSYNIDLDIDGALDMDADINADARVNADADVRARIEELPKIELGVDPLEIKPLDMSLRLKEIQPTRISIPADFKVGLNLLGLELMTIRL